MLEEGASAAADLGLGAADDLRRLESNGRLDDVDAVSSRARERGMSSMGTLGSATISPNFKPSKRSLTKQQRHGALRGSARRDDSLRSRGLCHQVCTDHVRHLERQFASDDGGWRHEGYDWWIPDRQLAAALDTPLQAEALA